MFGKITMTTILLIFLCLAVCFVQQAEGLVGMNCNETSQCEPGECCQKLSIHRILSRRDADYDDNPKHPGVCAQYWRLGDICDSYDKHNGYCGCEPGTECQTHKVTLKKKRRFSRSSEDGFVHNCSKIETTTKTLELS
ncbi:U3-aranetoxin-Ce1a [Biomphalaria glabrata]|nr:U3-aranetoxin-Ce1a [Biomphalaria glabrata]